MDYLEVAKNLERQGKIKKSAVYYLKAYDRVGDAHLALKAGELYCSIGSFRQASTIFSLVCDNGNSLIYEKIVDILLKTGNYSSAIQYFSLFFSTAPKIKKFQFANTLFKYELYADAERWYACCLPSKVNNKVSPYQIYTDHQIASCLPHFSAKNLSRANTLFDEGEYKRAQKLYLRELKRSAYCKIRLAECHLQLGSIERAKRIYRSLFNQTKNGYYAFMIAECYLLEGSGCEAQAYNWYQTALKNNCNYSNHALGRCYQKGIGVPIDTRIAKEYYLKGINCIKDRDFCNLGLASLCYENGDLLGANNYYKKVLTSENPDVLYQLTIHHFNGYSTGLSQEQISCCLAKSSALGNKDALKIYKALTNA